MEVHFTLWSYLGSRAAFIGSQVFLAALFGVLMLLAGHNASLAAFAVGLMVLMLCVVLVVGYLRRRSFYLELAHVMEQVERARHVPALLQEPSFLDGRMTYGCLLALARVSADETAELEEEAKEYRNFIELWIHEVKTPLAAAELMAARLRGPDAFTLRRELERIESQLENVLYYARSTNLTADYRLQDIVLLQVVQESCKKNASFLVERGVRVDFSGVDESCQVVADASWTSFVVSQVVVNAAKYGARTVQFASFTQEEETPFAHTVLEIADDGCGIAEQDAARVFDKGFVGTNGRAAGSATGMGLYLCALMCRRMGLGLSLRSQEGVGTTVSIAFPHDRRRQECFQHVNLTEV